jgi:hypothetical protein
MGLLWLLACGSIQTPGGTERVRGGLWVEGAFASRPGDVVVVLANSPLPCRPEDTEDLPTTIPDEAAGAEAWWQAQFAAAWTREDAVVLVAFLGGADTVESFTLAGRPRLGPKAGTGSAVALRVEEAAVAEVDGAVYTYEAVERTVATGLTGELTAAAAGEGFSVALDLGEWGADADVARCDNPQLVALALAAVDGLAAGLGVEE